MTDLFDSYAPLVWYVSLHGPITGGCDNPGEIRRSVFAPVRARQEVTHVKIRIVGVLASAVLLTACTAGGDADTTTAAGSADTASPRSTTAGPPRNAQGRIEKNFGEPAGLNDNVSGEPAFTFILSNPRVNPECTGFWQITPNGQYLFVDVEAVTSVNYSQAVTGAGNRSVKQMADRSLRAGNWRGVGPDGVVLPSLISTAALNCDELNDDAFAEPFAPASTYRGTYAFDVPVGTKSIYLDMLGKDISWEWRIPETVIPGAPGAPSGF
ncbi:hypothetical protein [Rhodococcus ruber]|uniref:hypothetical protein n=1 Tax=Rhodococcus ruber TaxID=1830 RepID=UPI000C7C8274|nr:hypothetical protein [Rhodococcus ruber]AUM16941.1 hypothetical protein CSW53_10595 [Rhodococcus ruber]AXY52505.1 hypothetical protein YT1_3100 [Rhodococcus ruber]